MQVQLELLRAHGTGNFRTLLIGVAQDPAMLVFLDAGRNVKDAPNENFGREVMELFPMGVGNYSEQDVREAARAFTGWIDDDLSFRFDASKHDERDKTFLGRTGPFDGVDVLDIILEQPVTRSTSRRKSIASSCGTTHPPNYRRASAPCCATASMSSRRSCGPSSCRGTSIARPRSAHRSRGRSN